MANLVCHAGANISSIDVHIDGTRFLTSGADNKAKVWNLLPVLDAKQEEDRSIHRLLATLTDHFGSVNVARFSRYKSQTVLKQTTAFSAK